MEEIFAWVWGTEAPDAPDSVQLHENHTKALFHSGTSVGCTAVRGPRALARNMEHFFEVEISPPFHGQARMVGVGTKFALMETIGFNFQPLIGKDSNSWGINYTGKIRHNGVEEDYADTGCILESTDPLIIGVLYDAHLGIMSFQVNGKQYGVAFTGIPVLIDIYPMACSSSGNSCIKLLRSWSEVASLRCLCRAVIRDRLADMSLVNELPLPNDLKAYLDYKVLDDPVDKSYTTTVSGKETSV